MYKKLYLAKSFKELLEKSEYDPPNLSLDRYLSSMKKLHDSARQAELEKDQEKEFRLLHRYFILLTAAQRHPEFIRKKYLPEFTRAQKNLNKYESLKDILNNRYEENISKEKDNLNSSVKPISSPTHEKTLKDITNHKTAGKLNKTSIRSEELFSLLNSKINNNNKDSYIIIDVRSAYDFKESHLNMPNVINIPEEIITPGVSAAALSKILPPDVKAMWDKRGTFNKLIILDWNSNGQNLKKEAKLYVLREAIVKWDPSTPYKSLPMILEGGYEDLLAKYPHITTNPKVIPPISGEISIPLSLDSFDYPIQILEPEEVKKPLASQPQKSVHEKQSLVIDRSTKPILKDASEAKLKEESLDSEKNSEVIATEDEETTVESSSQSFEEDISNKVIEKENQEPAEVISPPKQNPKEMLSELRKVKPQESSQRPQSIETMKGGDEDTNHRLRPEHGVQSLSNRPTSEKRATEGTYRVPLKKEDGSSSGILKRSSSSPNIAKLDDDVSLKVPSYTRSNKPMVYAERADSTYGTTAAGLTGLKNFANNCYMNSILQCLSNTHSLVTELISINRNLVINSHSKTKGRVAQEVISAFRNMWSGDVRVYSIKELKNILGGLKEIFKGTGHQDSNEFLIILLEYLHEDLNIPANVESRLDGAKEETGEKAWGEFRRKNCSIIQRLFYGQHRSTVTCSTCGHSSVTFEQFFNLFVPIPSKDYVSLNDCIQLYMSGEKISGWKCPKCKDERNATKKFDISRLPPILVIALKRFTHEEDSWLQKKENLVTYPLEGLDMERFTVEGSEQRYTKYNLYAMSTHTGTLRAGHYKAICKNHLTEKWYMFDDQSVEALPAHSVRNNPEVYILFYNAVTNC